MTATIDIDENIKEMLIEKALEQGINMSELANFYLLDGIKNNKNQFRLLTIDEIKKQIQPVAQEYKMKKIYLFGSYARGDANLESNVDLLLELPEKMSLIKLSGFYADVKDAIGRTVDIATIGGIDEEFKKNIWNDKILIYGE